MTLLQPMHLAALTANIMMSPLVLREVGFCRANFGMKKRVFSQWQHLLALPLKAITRPWRQLSQIKRLTYSPKFHVCARRWPRTPRCQRWDQKCAWAAGCVVVRRTICEEKAEMSGSALIIITWNVRCCESQTCVMTQSQQTCARSVTRGAVTGSCFPQPVFHFRLWLWTIVVVNQLTVCAHTNAQNVCKYIAKKLVKYSVKNNIQHL